MSATVKELEKDILLIYRGYLSEIQFKAKYIKPENIGALFDFIYINKLPITFDYSALRENFNIAGRFVNSLNLPAEWSINYLQILDIAAKTCEKHGIDFHTFLNKEELDLHYIYNILDYDAEIGNTTVNIIIYINLFILKNKLVDTRFMNRPVNPHAYDYPTDNYGDINYDFDPLS